MNCGAIFRSRLLVSFSLPILSYRNEEPVIAQQRPPNLSLSHLVQLFPFAWAQRFVLILQLSSF